MGANWLAAADGLGTDDRDEVAVLDDESVDASEVVILGDTEVAAVLVSVSDADTVGLHDGLGIREDDKLAVGDVGTGDRVSEPEADTETVLVTVSVADTRTVGEELGDGVGTLESTTRQRDKQKV